MGSDSQEYLAFHLYGPMASWGDVAVGSDRPTADRPSLSGVLGLVAGSLGVRRDQESVHISMANSYGMAVQSSTGATMMRDYHTVQVVDGRSKNGARPRSTALTDPKNLNTAITHRDYYCNSMHSVFLWSKGQDPPFNLNEMAEALNCPVFVPYLGRKSCPLAMPMGAKVVKASSIIDAIREHGLQSLSRLGLIPLEMIQPPFRISSTMTLEGLNGLHMLIRRDLPSSRTRWQFKNRNEYSGFLEGDDVLQ